MANHKLVLIGGGSVKWAPHIATDLFLTPELDGSTLVLVDIDREAAGLVRDYLRLLIQQLGASWTVKVDELDPALGGADAVGVAISTGGLEAMERDCTIPAKYGVLHAVGDTVGPGGISRTLRNVPVFVDLAQRMEQHCPRAWMVHVTNPLSQITRAVTKATGVRCVGLCHNYLGTRAFLANLFKCQREEVQATSVGVNHFTWLKDLTVRGQDVMDQLTMERYLEYEANKQGDLITGSTEELEPNASQHGHRYYLNFELCEMLGYFPVGAASHVAENYPHYLNSQQMANRHRIYRKSVLPGRAESTKKNRRLLIDRLEGREPLPTMEQMQDSIEQLAPITAALIAGKTTSTVLSLPNEGQIPNLPRGAVVETWANASWDRITPCFAGDVPMEVAGPVMQIVHEQELAVEAALSGDRQKVIQAMHTSPMLADKDTAVALADELLQANAQWLPQFNSRLKHH